MPLTSQTSQSSLLRFKAEIIIDKNIAVCQYLGRPGFVSPFNNMINPRTVVASCKSIFTSLLV